jgi:putative transposase
MPYAQELAQQVPVTTICQALALSRSRYYRFQQQQTSGKAEEVPVEKPNHKPHSRALTQVEEIAVRDLLNSNRFQDMSPYEVYGTLLDEDGRYLCSVRTMYRILKKHGETSPRGRQRAHTQYSKPELLATAPNQVWSWDISKLKGAQKWSYYYLYVMLDIFSRYVVGWLIAPRESAALAKELMGNCCLQQGIDPGQLTIHADRGSAMTSKAVAHLLADLGVTKTHARPYTSNDNPFSEAQFKTLKYRPDFPDRFGSLQDARAWARPFFHWYNNEHRHSSLALMTPAIVHAGLGVQVRQQRQDVLAAAFLAHPERFVCGQPQPAVLPEAVWINPPLSHQASIER